MLLFDRKVRRPESRVGDYDAVVAKAVCVRRECLGLSVVQVPYCQDGIPLGDQSETGLHHRTEGASIATDGSDRTCQRHR